MVILHIRSESSEEIARGRPSAVQSVGAENTRPIGLVSFLLLQRPVDAGNSVMEHNRDIIKGAEWIVELGPEGVTAGGD